MKHRILGAALAALFATSALSQVNVVPQVGLTTGYLSKITFSSAFFGLVPVTAGTDVVCIAGSATKTVRLQRLVLYGTAATAPQALPINLVRRALVDTAGTPASTTANPGVATQIASRDTGTALNTASTATLISYVANPTINDTAPVYLDSKILYMPVVTSVANPEPADFYFVRDAVNLIQSPTLRGAAQQICVNMAGATLTNAAVWNGVITWTEE
jgi:hypothetical protein